MQDADLTFPNDPSMELVRNVAERHAMPTLSLDRPVFIVGCRGSGATILGRSLSLHPEATYLNEPTNIWALCYPESDVSSAEAISRGGKIVLTAADVRESCSRRLRGSLAYEALTAGRPVWVEKQSINSFRLPFVHKIFPDAQFVHVLRNGLEVARAIESLADCRSRSGHVDYRWNQLVCFAKSQGVDVNLPDFPRDSFERGLLEWRLSTEAIHSFAETLPYGSYFEFSYDAFVDEPVKTVNRVLSFIEISECLEVSRFVAQTVRRQLGDSRPIEYSDRDLKIGGAELQRFALNA